MLPLEGAWVQSLVGELKSCMPYSAATENKTKQNKTEDITVVTLGENGPGTRDEGALRGAGKVLFHDHDAGHTVLFIKLGTNDLFLYNTSIKILKIYAY